MTNAVIYARYSSEKQTDGKPVIETMSYKLSDEYDTVAKINILALRKGYTWNRFICLDNVVASLAETGKPYIANDDGSDAHGARVPAEGG